MSPRFHQKLFLSLIPHPFCFLEFDGKVLTRRRWFRTLCELPVDAVDIQIKPRGVLGVLAGFGDITVHRQGAAFTFPGVQFADTLRQRIESAKSMRPEEVEEQRLLSTYRSFLYARFYAGPCIFFMVVLVASQSQALEWINGVYLVLGVLMVPGAYWVLNEDAKSALQKLEKHRSHMRQERAAAP